MYKEKIRDIDQYQIRLHFVKLTQQMSFRNLNLKLDPHTGGKWFIHGPKKRKANQLLSQKHSCWLSWVYYVNMIIRRSMETSPIRFFSRRKFVGENILETVPHTLDISY